MWAIYYATQKTYKMENALYIYIYIFIEREREREIAHKQINKCHIVYKKVSKLSLRAFQPPLMTNEAFIQAEAIKPRKGGK